MFSNSKDGPANDPSVISSPAYQEKRLEENVLKKKNLCVSFLRQMRK